MNPNTISVAGLALSLLLAGCSTFASKSPGIIKSTSAEANPTNDNYAVWRTQYGEAFNRGDYATARLLRNRMVQRARLEIDEWYGDYEARLYQGRATMNIFADFGELSLAGAAAITHGEQAKTILASILTVAKGTRISYDKNWFQEKATDSLLNAMRSGRSSKLAEILAKSASEVTDYPLEEAWADLIAYYQCGTLHGGLLTLSAQSGQKAADAEQKVAAITETLHPLLATATADDVTETRRIRAKALALPPEKMRQVLTAMQVEIPSEADDAKLKALVNDLVRELRTADKDRRKTIITTIDKASP